MFSGELPFESLNEHQFVSALMQGRRPSRPLHALSATRGLNDKVWHLVEACWGELPGNRPTADEIIKTLYPLPRSFDSRVTDNFNIISSSQMWSKQDHHPFSALTTSEDDSNNMRKLKWLSDDDDSEDDGDSEEYSRDDGGIA